MYLRIETLTRYAALAMLLVGLTSCGDSSKEPTAPTEPESVACTGGKCDGVDAIRLISNLSMAYYQSSAGESESFKLMGEITEGYYMDVEDGHELSVEIWAADGASNPDFRISDKLTYEADYIGGYISDTIDTSMLLPWMALRVRVFGTLGDKPVDQTFAFAPGETEGTEVRAEAPTPIALLSTLSMNSYESSAGESESFQLIGEVAEAYYMSVPDGHTLNVEIWAADGASNPDYRIPAELEYEADYVGGYISGTIDTSSLLPWQALKVRVFGAVDNVLVDQTFAFEPGSTEGVLAGAETESESIALLDTLDMVNYEASAGESESFQLMAEIAEGYYMDVEDGHELSLEIWAADGASNPDFRISGTLTYEADYVGGYVSETLDTSMLLPWMALRVRVFGDLGDKPVDQTFEFEAGSHQGVPVTD